MIPRGVRTGDLIFFEDMKNSHNKPTAIILAIWKIPRNLRNGFYFLTLLWYDGHIESSHFHTLEFDLITYGEESNED